MSSKKASAATRVETGKVSASVVNRYTVGEALVWGRARLRHRVTASLDAQLLLGHVLRRQRSWVLAHADSDLSADETEAFASLVESRASGVPVAYLRGYRDWYGRQLRVGPAVLIPRPETELLVEEAIALARRRQAHVLVDVGTGSGAIAVQLALTLPEGAVFGLDISRDALRVARQNVENSETANRVTLLAGDLLEPLAVEPDLIVANLPYLSDSMMEDIERDVRHEPPLALHGGRTGLELYRRLLEQRRARGWCSPLVVEIDPRQALAFTAMAVSEFEARRVRVVKDYTGDDRIVVVDE